MLKSRTTAVAIAVLVLSTAMARSHQSDPTTPAKLAQTTSPTPGKEANLNAKLADAASINEDLIGLSLEGKADKVAEKVVAMRKALPSLRPLLNASSFETLGRQLTEMEQASSKSDVFGTALVAVEAYRVIENAMDTASRPSPIEVSMLDYSGFKLSILASTQHTDWATIATTATDSDGSWAALDHRVKDASIRNLVKAIQEGLRGAVERKDIYGVKFAARMQLEAVDVLEQYFKRNPASGGTVHQ
jgi:hypothetical protein